MDNEMIVISIFINFLILQMLSWNSNIWRQDLVLHVEQCELNQLVMSQKKYLSLHIEEELKFNPSRITTESDSFTFSPRFSRFTLTHKDIHLETNIITNTNSASSGNLILECRCLGDNMHYTKTIAVVLEHTNQLDSVQIQVLRMLLIRFPASTWLL